MYLHSAYSYPELEMDLGKTNREVSKTFLSGKSDSHSAHSIEQHKAFAVKRSFNGVFQCAVHFQSFNEDRMVSFYGQKEVKTEMRIRFSQHSLYELIVFHNLL